MIKRQNTSFSRRTISIILAGAMALTVAGCGETKTTKVEDKYTANKGDFTSAYVNTVFVNVPEKSKGDIKSTEEKQGEDSNIEECGSANTVNEKYELPTLSASEEVYYFSPVIGNEKIEGIEHKDSGDKVTELAIIMGGEETTGYKVNEPGVYTIKLQSGDVDVEVKEGSLFDDEMEGNYTQNLVVNANSLEVKELMEEYNVLLPIMLNEYISLFENRDEAFDKIREEKSKELIEFNRLRILMGEEPLNITSLVEMYVTEEKVEASKEKVKESDKYSKRMTNGIGDNNQYTITMGDDLDTNARLDVNIHTLINEIRQENGLAPLGWTVYGSKIIKNRALEITQNFSHSTSLYVEGENIGKSTSPDASEMVNAWMNSPSHRANILNKTYVTGAAAVAYSNGRYYFVIGFYTDLFEQVIEKKANGEAVEKTTSDGVKYNYTTSTDANGNTVIQFGTKADSEGWADAHIDKSRSDFTDYYEMQKLTPEEIQYRTEHGSILMSDGTVYNAYVVQQTVHVKQDGWVNGSGSRQYRLAYSDGRVEYIVDEYYAGTKYRNTDWALLADKPVKINIDPNSPYYRKWKFADE